MALPMPGTPQKETARDATTMSLPEDPQCCPRRWYFSRQEIECHTPSRADGIDYKRESHMRRLYCSFLQELGMELKVPQVTIATAMMFCHRFYMRQSHAKNDWQTIATVCMFLACKAEETPRWLGELVHVACRLLYKWDPSATRRIREIYDKQKELILTAERLLLATIAFELNIEHPYKPLIAALKRLDLNNDLVKVAWNFVNDWMRTSLCLQHKPHYIAAGSMFLAAKFQKEKLPTKKGNVWWMQFDVSPKQLEEVIQQMMGLWEKNRKQALPPKERKVTESNPVTGKSTFRSPRSCALSGSIIAQDSKIVASDDSGGLTRSATSNCMEKQAVGSAPEISKETIHSQTSDCGSADSVVEDCVGEPAIGKSDQDSSYNIVSVEGSKTQIDADRIRETLKRRKSDRSKNKKFPEATDDDIDGEAWIERELEKGIEADSPLAKKRRKLEVL